MNEDRDESFESPLEAVINETPQEQPPPDLKQRCLQAVRDAEAARAPRRPAVWPIVWKSAAGLAAAFVVMVLGITVFVQPKRAAPLAMAREGQARAMQAQSHLDKMALSIEAAKAGPVEALPQAQPQAGAARVVTRERLSAGDVPYTDASGDEARLGVDYAASGPGGGTPGGAPGGGMPRAATERQVVGRVGLAPPAGAPAPPPDTEEAEYARNALSEPINGKVDYIPDGGPERPWRDESGERQKITNKEMKLAVEDIEDAHERATSIITRAKGCVDTEDMRVNERGQGEAIISARVPVEGLDGVVSQLRELGKVLEIRGESEDRTKEYYGRGQSIRELAEQELQLVAKYEKEENRSRKQQLLYQIRSLRQQIKAQKEPLNALSGQTHFAFLSLTLTQAEGPKQFLNRLTQSVPTAGAWLAISAIFWVPVLLVVIVVWRKVAARATNG